MYLKYVTNPTSVLADVLSDIAALASGSPISALSTSCDKVASQLLASVDAPGWTLLDATGPGSSKVLTAKDISGGDKFISLIPSGTTAFYIGAYDTYNAVTHTGVNLSSVNTTKLPYSATVANTYNLLINARRLLVTNSDGGVVNGSIEFAREAAYLSNLNYPAHAIIFDQAAYQSPTNFAIPRTKNMIASGDVISGTGCAALMALTSVFNNNSWVANVSNTPMRDAGDSIYHQMLPLYVGVRCQTGGQQPMFALGRIIDAFLGTAGYGSMLDTVNDGTDTFLVLSLMSNGNTIRTLFKIA